METELDGFTISSNFDSGNLQRIETTTPGLLLFDGLESSDVCQYEFNCWIQPDCAGTEYENNNRTWFYFSVTDGPGLATVRFNLMNMNRQAKLYAQGMRTVYRVEPALQPWTRLDTPHHYKLDDGNFILSFCYTLLEDPKCVHYFAFTYPYSYSELQTHLASLTAVAPPAGVYVHRELLVYTLDGRRVDLLTVTAAGGAGDAGYESVLPSLFPDATPSGRAARFPTRKVVLLSARVHPGEAPSSHVMNGCLRLLLSDDPRARALRQLYVFKIIPMLNPDGVARGHYRTNIHGTNLNRMYSDPCPQRHPEVYASKCLALYHHLGLPPSDEQLLESAQLSARCMPPSSADESTSTAAVGHYPHPTVCASVATGSSSAAAAAAVDEETSNASCVCGDAEESSMGPLDLGPLKSMLIQPSSAVAALPSRIDGAVASAVEAVVVETPACEPVSTDSHVAVSLEEAARTVSTAVSSRAAGLTSAMPQPILAIATAPPTTAPLSQSSTGVVTSSLDWQESECDITPPSPPVDQSQLFLYVDMHGHASKRGCFMYGNHFNTESDMVECMLLPKLVSLNSENFDFLASNFTQKNMHTRGKRDGLSKEGSGRVAVYRATRLVRSYTLECNYNTGRFRNAMPSIPTNTGQAASESSIATTLESVQTTGALEPIPYTPAEYAQVGEAMLISLLDMTGDNCCSLLPHTECRSVHGVRDWIRRFLQVTRFAETGGVTFSPHASSRMRTSSSAAAGVAHTAGDIARQTGDGSPAAGGGRKCSSAGVTAAAGGGTASCPAAAVPSAVHQTAAAPVSPLRRRPTRSVGPQLSGSRPAVTPAGRRRRRRGASQPRVAKVKTSAGVGGRLDVLTASVVDDQENNASAGVCCSSSGNQPLSGNNSGGARRRSLPVTVNGPRLMTSLSADGLTPPTASAVDMATIGGHAGGRILTAKQYRPPAAHDKDAGNALDTSTGSGSALCTVKTPALQPKSGYTQLPTPGFTTSGKAPPSRRRSASSAAAKSQSTAAATGHCSTAICGQPTLLATACSGRQTALVSSLSVKRHYGRRAGVKKSGKSQSPVCFSGALARSVQVTLKTSRDEGTAAVSSDDGGCRWRGGSAELSNTALLEAPPGEDVSTTLSFAGVLSSASNSPLPASPNPEAVTCDSASIHALRQLQKPQSVYSAARRRHTRSAPSTTTAVDRTGVDSVKTLANKSDIPPRRSSTAASTALKSIRTTNKTSVQCSTRTKAKSVGGGKLCGVRKAKLRQTSSVAAAPTSAATVARRVAKRGLLAVAGGSSGGITTSAVHAKLKAKRKRRPSGVNLSAAK